MTKISPGDMEAKFLKYEADDVYRECSTRPTELFEVQQVLPSTPKLLAKKGKKFLLLNRAEIQADLADYRRRVSASN